MHLLWQFLICTFWWYSSLTGLPSMSQSQLGFNSVVWNPELLKDAHNAQQQMFSFPSLSIALIISPNKICYLIPFLLILYYFPQFHSMLSMLNYTPDIENFMLWGSGYVTIFSELLILVGKEFGWTQNRNPSFGWQLKSQFSCFPLSCSKAPRWGGVGSPGICCLFILQPWRIGSSVKSAKAIKMGNTRDNIFYPVLISFWNRPAFIYFLELPCSCLCYLVQSL